MKALFVTHAFPRAAGDMPGSFLLRLAAALRESQVEVRVIAPSAAGLTSSQTIDGVAVERFRYAPRRFERLAYTGAMVAEVRRSPLGKLTLGTFLAAEFVSVRRAIRRFRPDVVHAHWWFPAGLVSAGAIATTAVPLVTTLHGTDVRLARAGRLVGRLFRNVVVRSRAVTAVSRWLATEAERLAPSSRVVVAPMPADTDTFQPGGTRDPCRLLFVGRLTEQKGVGSLLRAFARQTRQAVLDIVGDGPLRPEAQDLARHLGVADRVRWIGAVDQPALLPFYRHATALVVPSRDEGLGLVAAEALLCETPVVAYASGGLTDVVIDERTGLLAPPGDEAALAGRIAEVLASPDRGHFLGRAGRQHALSLFAPEAVARRYVDVYRSAVGSAS